MLGSGHATVAAQTVHKCKQANGTIAYSETPCETTGARPLGAVKVEAAPVKQNANASQPGLQARIPGLPPGVDQPLADPTRPDQCRKKQNEIDEAVFEVKRATLKRAEQKAHYDALQKQMDAAGANAIHTFSIPAARQRDDEMLTREMGTQRLRLEAHLQEAARLNCDVVGVKLNLAEAEQLRPKAVSAR